MGSPTTVAVDLAALIQAVRELNNTMQSVLQRLESPTRTAGDEYTRRAALALRNEWFDDALTDAVRSIEAYPYTPTPYLLGSLACIGRENLGQALDLLRRGIPYGRAESQGHVVVMALLASRLAAVGGNSTLATDLIHLADDVTAGRSTALQLSLAAERPDSVRVARAAELLRCDPGSFYGLAIPEAVAQSDPWRSVQKACDRFKNRCLKPLVSQSASPPDLLRMTANSSVAVLDCSAPSHA